MNSDPKYVRVYYSIIDDPRFVGIFESDRNLSAWLRLLMQADAVWPASASVPDGTHPIALRALVDAGLVEFTRGRRFRLHGLDAERDRRNVERQNGGTIRAASAVRDGHGRFLPAGVPARVPAVATSGGTPANQLSKDEQSIDEQRRAGSALATMVPVDGSPRDSLDTYYELTGSRPWGKRSGEWLHDLEEKHGLVRLEATLRTAARESTEKLLDRTAAILERAADQRPVALVVPIEEQRAQLRKAAADQHAREEAAEARVAEYRRTHDPNTGVRIDGGIDP